MNKKVLFAGLLSGLLLVGCSNGEDTTSSSSNSSQDSSKIEENSSGSSETTVKPTEVAITGSKYIAVGKETTLTATVSPEDATNKTITWSSSDETVATVDDSGKVTGIKKGSAKIVATSSVDTVKAEFDVSVDIAPTKLDIPGYHYNVLNGEELQLEINVSGEGASNAFVATIEDDTICDVDDTGKITSKKIGETKITFKSLYDESIDDSIVLHVGSIPTGLELYLPTDEAETKLTAGEVEVKQSVVYKVNYLGDAPYYGCVVESSNPEIATVKVNKSNEIAVKGVKVGQTTITVKSSVDETKFTSITFEVKEPKGLLIPDEGLVFELGENGDASHKDGSGAGSDVTLSEGTNKIYLTECEKVYTNSFDAKGNSCIKLGTGDIQAKFTLTVPEEVKSVEFKVAKYKKNKTTFIVNGEEHVLTKNSNDGEYDVITIDTSTVKVLNVTTAAASKDGCRAMINSITLKK